MNNDQRKIIGYNPNTGEPIYEEVAAPVQPKIVGYNPQTGEPIYENSTPAQPKIVGYNPQTGEPIYENSTSVQPKIVGYNTQTGEPIYDNAVNQPVYTYNAPQKKGSKLWLKILITILVLALIGGLATGLYFTFRGDADTEESDDDNRGGRTINDYDDDDDYDDDNDDDDDYDDDDDDDDDTVITSSSFKSMGYIFTQVDGYKYTYTTDEVVMNNGKKQFDILLNGNSIDTLASDLSYVDEGVASAYPEYTLGKAQVKYISGNKCVTLEVYDKEDDAKGLIVFTKAPESNNTFYILYSSIENTYDYTGFAEFYTLIKDIEYVGGYKAVDLSE